MMKKTMKKTLAAVLATTALFGATAFAANPFDNVGRDTWEYKAVQGLAQAGIIQGSAKEDLKSKQGVTRIEMAEMVASAATHMEKADIDQKAVILKLAKTYKTEIESIMSAKTGKKFDLKKIIPIQYGDVQFRYMSGPTITDVKKGSLASMYAKVGPDVQEAIANSAQAQAFLNQVGGYAGAMKLKAIDETLAKPSLSAEQQAALNAEKTMVQGALRTPQGRVKLAEQAPIITDFNRHKVEKQFDTTLHLNLFGVLTPRTKALARLEVKSLWGDSHSVKAKFDRLLIAEKLGKVDVVIGRQGVEIGSGLTYNDYFDGVLASYKKGDTRYTLAHGWPSYYKSQFSSGEEDPASMAYVLHAGQGHLQATYGQISTKFGKAEGKVYYMRGNDGIPVSAAGVSLDYYKNKLWVGGEYAKLLGVDKLPQPYGLLSSLLDDTYAWTAGVGYGDFNPIKAGTWNVKARYLFEGRVAPIMNNYTFNQPFINNYKAWNVEANYTIKKNLTVNVSTFFNGKSVKNTERYSNLYSLAVNYKF